tara:strand:+ start:5029 stop:5973 length:945 start_codon:yes stop_codon:yes gene_type:complete
MNRFKVLVTTTSFQDSPGRHHDLLAEQDWDITFMRGPLKESELYEIIGKYDGVLCGDDEYSRKILKKGSEGRLKCLSKYGVGLDKIDTAAAKEYKVSVTNCPGINQNSVAEHVLALVLAFEKNICEQHNFVQKGIWKRLVGREIKGKTIGVIGLGFIGKEISIIMSRFGLTVLVYDITIDEEFIQKNSNVKNVSLEFLIKNSDYISLHLPLNVKTKGFINKKLISKMNPDVLIINTARGELIDKKDMIDALEEKTIRGYLCDVLDVEPVEPDEKLLGMQDVIITPHVGSRTKENIVNQGIKSLENLIESLKVNL